MSANSQSYLNYVLSNSAVRLVVSTAAVFIAISMLKSLWVFLQRRWHDDDKLRSFEKTKCNPRRWFFGHLEMVSNKSKHRSIENFQKIDLDSFALKNQCVL